MKTLTAFPVLYALSFLMVSVGSGSAQTSLHPDNLEVSLDSAFITYNMNQATITPDTVRGSITSLNYTGSFGVALKSIKQWIISTKINGGVVQNGDMIGIAANQTLPVEVIITPHAEGPDTESYCLYISAGSGASQCITLATRNPTSAASTDLPIPNVILEPNPAGSYIFARGLSNEQVGYRYEIFSISGAEVRHGILPADEHINVQDIPSGAYRFLLFDSKRTLTNTAITILH